ncbi:MAG: YbaN family protein [Bacteroidales bacterium]|nr:YbaN family protein [Bacteroidales bacterium]
MKKYILIISGLLSLFLGILGIFLPVLPTTPFLLLSAACFLKSSKSLYDWLLNHKQLGNYIKDFMIYKAISKKLKVVSITTLWLTIFLSVWVVKIIWLKFFLILIAIGVSVHILCFKTKK